MRRPLALGHLAAEDEGLGPAADAGVQRPHDDVGRARLREPHGPDLAGPGRPDPEGTDRVGDGGSPRRPAAPGAADVVLKASRNRSRKASIGHTGAVRLGSSPSCQSQPSIRSSTAGSAATTEIGTWWVASGPVTSGRGWWSPSITRTRSSSCSRDDPGEERLQGVLDGLAVEPPDVVRVAPGLLGRRACSRPWARRRSRRRAPSQGTMVGSGVHGWCEETRSISAMTGACPGVSSSRWKASRVNWSGIAAQLNVGPW